MYKNFLGSSLISVGSSLLTFATTVHAQSIIYHPDPLNGDQAEIIRNLEVNGILYDVIDFRTGTFTEIFGDPSNPNIGAAFWNNQIGAETATAKIINLFNAANPIPSGVYGTFFFNGSTIGSSISNDFLIPFGIDPDLSQSSLGFSLLENGGSWQSSIESGFGDLGGNVRTYAFFTVDSCQNPTLPTLVQSGRFVFENVLSGQCFDPPVVSGYTYSMDSLGSLFTGILDFPVGFDNPFTVSANNTILGEFSPGESVDFVSLLGSGVMSFSVTNISPSTDPNDPNAFPLEITFSTPTASFTQSAIITQSTPEPSNLVGLACLIGLGLLIKKQNINNDH